MDGNGTGMNHSLLRGEKKQLMPGFVSIKNKRDMSAMGFSQTVIDGCCWLAIHFDLNSLESFACQRAHKCVHHTTSFHGVAVEMLLSVKKEDPPSKF